MAQFQLQSEHIPEDLYWLYELVLLVSNILKSSNTPWASEERSHFWVKLGSTNFQNAWKPSFKISVNIYFVFTLEQDISGIIYNFHEKE